MIIGAILLLFGFYLLLTGNVLIGLMCIFVGTGIATGLEDN